MSSEGPKVMVLTLGTHRKFKLFILVDKFSLSKVLYIWSFKFDILKPFI